MKSNGSGYVLFWQARDAGDSVRNAYTSTSPTDDFVDFSSPQRLSDDSVNVSGLRAVSDGAGYAAVWQVSFGETDVELRASTLDGAAWAAQVTLDSSADMASLSGLAAGDAGYAVTYRESGETRFPAETYARVFDGAAWGAPELLYTEATSVGESESGGDGAQLVSNGDGYAATWLEFDPADGNVHVHFASYDGAQWSSRAIEDQAERAAWSLIADAGEGYTVLWAQPQTGGDPLVALPWVFPGLR